jgi:hypothetical protein
MSTMIPRAKAAFARARSKPAKRSAETRAKDGHEQQNGDDRQVLSERMAKLARPRWRDAAGWTAPR